MNILKFQEGAALPAYTHYSPIISSYSQARETEGGAASSKASKKEGFDIDLELYKLLGLLKALPNESRDIAARVKNLILNKTVGAIDTDKIALELIDIQERISEAKFNLDKHTESYNQIKSNGGSGEMAVSSDGKIFCRSNIDPDDYEFLSPQEFLENYHDYTALTNQLLLDLRAENPGLIGNNAVLSIVNNGIGFEGIQKLINQAITTIGTTTILELGYSRMLAHQIVEGLDYARNSGVDTDQLSLDGTYKITPQTKLLVELAKMALQYIYSMLPKNVKTILTVKAAENGIKAGAIGLINNLISSKLSETKTEKVELQKDTNAKSKSSKVSTTDDSPLAKLKLTPVMMMLLEKGELEPYVLNPGTKYSINVSQQNFVITDASHNPISSKGTLEEVSTSEFSGGLILEEASFGGIPIKREDVDKVQILSNTFHFINLPFEIREDGAIVPDFKYSKKLEEAEKLVKRDLENKKDLTEEERIEAINKIYTDNGLPFLLHKDGSLNVTRYRKFGVVEARVADKFLDTDDPSTVLAREVNEEYLINDYLYQINKGRGNDSDSKIDLNIPKDWWFDSTSTVYKGTVYIPVKKDLISGAMTSKNELTVGDANTIQALLQQKARIASSNDNIDGISHFEQ